MYTPVFFLTTTLGFLKHTFHFRKGSYRCPQKLSGTFFLCPVNALLLLLLSRFIRVRLCAPHSGQPARLRRPWDRQARTLEWVAISFSSAWKWKVKVNSLSHVWLLSTPWTAAYQAPPSMGVSRQEYWSGVPIECYKNSNMLVYIILSAFSWSSHTPSLLSFLRNKVSFLCSKWSQ